MTTLDALRRLLANVRCVGFAVEACCRPSKDTGLAPVEWTALLTVPGDGPPHSVDGCQRMLNALPALLDVAEKAEACVACGNLVSDEGDALDAALAALDAVLAPEAPGTACAPGPPPADAQGHRIVDMCNFAACDNPVFAHGLCDFHEDVRKGLNAVAEERE